jgi:hypothetical protein
MSPPVSRRANNEPGRKSGMFVFDSKLGANSSRGTKRARPDELHELRSRLRTLENSVGRPSVLQTPETSVGDFFSPSEGETAISSENVGVEDRVRFLPDASFRGKKAKTRYFGRSHYTTTVSFVSTVPGSVRLLLTEHSSKTLVHLCAGVTDAEKSKIRNIVT